MNAKLTRPTMKNKNSDPSPVTFNELTVETEIDTEIVYTLKNHNIAKWLRICKKKNLKVGEKFRLGREARHKLLEEVYNLGCAAHQNIDELRAIAKKSDLRFNKKTNIFAFILKAIYGGDNLNRRKVSEQASALQYLYHQQVNGEDVAVKLEKFGGTRKCADLHAELRREQRKEKTKDVSDESDKLWKELKSREPVTVIESDQDEIVKGRYIAVLGCTESGDLRIYKKISVKDDIGRKLLRMAAKA